MNAATPTIPTSALVALSRARHHLVKTSFVLDDVGLQCPALDRLASDAAHLFSRWRGRPGRPPEFPEVPEWICRAAVEWRAERDRRRRT